MAQPPVRARYANKENSNEKDEDTRTGRNLRNDDGGRVPETCRSRGRRVPDLDGIPDTAPPAKTQGVITFLVSLLLI
jgi:hypothetical protein